MDYHRDRFADHSVIVRDAGSDSLVALLPANRRGDVLESHGGLTYGGLVIDRAMTLSGLLAVFDQVVSHLRQEGIGFLRYRVVPHIYHRAPAEEDLVALARHGAELVHRTAIAILDRRQPIAAQQRRRRGAAKARAAGLACRESDALGEYWDLLSDVLRRTYAASPVHTLPEIESLRQGFPSQVRLFGAFRADAMVAGVLVFEFDTVARAQYIAASEEGKALAALDLLFDFMLSDVFADKPYIDFGSSESADRTGLNRGVLEFKESLGARTVVHDTYELAL